jgi:glutamyl-tRNA(Gln) amidotransferase subunit D
LWFDSEATVKDGSGRIEQRMDDLTGYRGPALELLKKGKARVGDVLEVELPWGEVRGTLVPRYAYNDDSHVVLKLSSGYNVGLAVANVKSFAVKSKGVKPIFRPPPAPQGKKGLPEVLLLSTGGTIGSRVDYRTGAVHPVVSSQDLHALIPELSEVATVKPEIMMSILSENMRPSHWARLSARVGEAVREGASGVVITHGTDTLGYTAAALSFSLAGIPIPVLLVGAQRSPDRPSSDVTLNLLAGVSLAASAPFSGVYVVMHADESDRGIAVHMGTRARKDHTSARAAFKSVGVPLAAVWTREGLEYVSGSLPKRGHDEGFKPRPSFADGAVLLKSFPGMSASMIDSAAKAGAKAIVVEGTGLGHVNAECTAALERFVSGGGVAFMTSQCINGRVDLDVYETGRDLVKAGVVPLADMLSETALAKASWALANSKTAEEVISMMASNVAGETTLRTLKE